MKKICLLVVLLVSSIAFGQDNGYIVGRRTGQDATGTAKPNTGFSTDKNIVYRAQNNPPKKKTLAAEVKSTATGHSATLNWTASTTTLVTGYNVYRGTAAGQESTTPLNSTPVTGTTYTDSTVNAGTTYFYTAEAYCPTCNPTLSVPSNEVQAVIPGNQPNPPTNLTVSSQ